MADKKRKATLASTDIPSKKSKKSKTADNSSKPEEIKTVEKSDNSAIVQNVDVATSKKSRKQAVDFMGEDEQTPAKPSLSSKSKKNKPSTAVDAQDPTATSITDLKKKQKKIKKSNKAQNEDLLTADGVNGVVEHAGHEDLETATSHQPVASSMQAEAERTVDQELKDDFGGLSDGDTERQIAASEIETEDNAAALLAGFDSDGEDKYEDENLDASSKLKFSKKKDKEVRKKLSQMQAASDKEGPGTVYVGRIPHGFYEKEMREYFSQFGEISKLRLSRNKRTGASKHFAFIEFSSNEVAKIVAETMDNYLLFDHLLKCKYAQPDSLHPDTWKGADKKFRKIPHAKLEREQLAAPKTEEQWEKKTLREKKKRNRKARKLEALGLELPTSTLTTPSTALKQQLEQAKDTSIAQIEDARVSPVGSIKASHGLPKDEVSMKEATKLEIAEEAGEGKKSKRAKKSKKSKAVGDSAVETSGEVVNGEAEAIEQADSNVAEEAKKFKRDKKSKKSKAIEDPAPSASADIANEEATAAEEPTTMALEEGKKSKRARKNKKNKQAEEVDKIPDAAGDVADKPETTTPVVETAAGSDAFPADEDDDGSLETLEAKQGKDKADKNKKKKERKNLVKARGPKHALAPTKPVSQSPQTSKTPGLAPMGKDKYNKAKRQEYKEAKSSMKKASRSGSS